MSLKGFHIFFIALSILLTAFLAVWFIVNDVNLVVGIGSAIGAVVLLVYGIRFVKKSKNIIT
jgi:hypothetical protein